MKRWVGRAIESFYMNCMNSGMRGKKSEKGAWNMTGKMHGGNGVFWFLIALALWGAGFFVGEPLTFSSECLASTADDRGANDSVMPFYTAPLDLSGRLALIKKRGVVIVGIKTDYPPWGMVDQEGNLAGLEADLAGDVARAIGVELKLTGVSTKNRLQKLEDGVVDLVIATMGDNAKRRKISGLIQPNY